MSKRTYHLVEEKYLAEYIGKTFPNAKKVFYQVPWNPVKELKDPPSHLNLSQKRRVESGEGIESCTDPVLTD